MGFDKKHFAILLARAKGDRSLNEYAKMSTVDTAHLSRLMRQMLNAPPSPETIQKLTSAAENEVTYDDFMKAAGHIKKVFTGQSLALLRGDKPHKEYAVYLQEKGVSVSPFILEAYEKGMHHLDESIIQDIARVEGVTYDDYSSGSTTSEPTGEYKVMDRQNFTFLDDEVYEWIQDPENADLITSFYEICKRVEVRNSRHKKGE